MNRLHLCGDAISALVSDWQSSRRKICSTTWNKWQCNSTSASNLGTLRSCLLSIQIRETLTYNVVHLLHHFVWHYLNLRWCIGPETDNRSESYVCKGPKKILVSFDFDLFWEWCEGKRDSFFLFQKEDSGEDTERKRSQVQISKER